jgi:hypothetical protein
VGRIVALSLRLCEPWDVRRKTFYYGVPGPVTSQSFPSERKGSYGITLAWLRISVRARLNDGTVNGSNCCGTIICSGTASLTIAVASSGPRLWIVVLRPTSFLLLERYTNGVYGSEAMNA